MKLPARKLSVQILAAAICLCVPWPGFAAEVAPSIAASAAAAPGAAFSPLFHQELQLSFDRLFPEGAESAASSLQALQAMQADYAQSKTGPAGDARAEAAEFLATALTDSPEALAQRLQAAGLSGRQAQRIQATAVALQARAQSDPQLAEMLRQVVEPIAATRAARESRLRAIIGGARGWHGAKAQPAFVAPAGSPEAPEQAPGPQEARSGELARPQLSRGLPGGADWVPTSKKVAQLQKLVKEQPEAAFAQAAQLLADQGEPRLEVRAASIRIVASFAVSRAFPVLVKVLTDDPSWYLKRMVAKWLGAHAGELAAQKEEAVKALKPSYRNSNPSVRLMTRWALEQFGVDPGPEVVPQKVATVPAPRPAVQQPAAPTQMSASRPNIMRRIFKWAFVIFASFILWSSLMAPHPKPVAPQQQSQTTQAPAQPTAQTPAPAAAAEAAVSPEAKVLGDINKNLEQIKEAQQKQAAIAEKQDQERGGLGSLLLNVLLMGLLPVVVMVWLFRRMQGGSGSAAASVMGKTNMNVEHPNVRFSDVAGVDDALKDVRQIIDYLDNPAKYNKLGGHAPRGVLLEGPPGTGKTLLARALAGEANAAFLSMKGSDFIQMFVGVGAARVRDLFNEARKNQPAIVFIDELDAIGGSRDVNGMGRGGESEHRQTLVALLAELDGFLKMDNVIVVAATNRAQDLDEALMRPGRFDRKIFVGNPDVLGREAILAVHGAKVRFGPDADVEFTAKRTPGLSGAAMANIINESALQAAMRDGTEITQQDLQRAVDKETFGDQRNLFLDEKTKRRVAEHEAGHALTGFFARLKRGMTANVANKITIIPHGKAALGYAEPAAQSEADTYLQTQDDLEAGIVGAMGGRAAEETIYPGKKGISTGPGSDIADHADRIARVMVEQLGMSEDVGIINAGADPRDPMGRSRISETTKYRVDQAIAKITGASLAEAKEYVRLYRGRFDRLVKALYEKETLFQEQIAEILTTPAPGDVDQPAK